MTAVGVRGWVVLERWEELQAALKKVNRQATKLGVPPMVCEQTGATELRVVKVRNLTLLGRIEEKALFVEAELLGEVPRLPGDWELLGVVDHSEGLPVVKCVPGRELPKGQRDRGARTCDHCGKVRRRVETFVLRSGADGRVVQVGRQCLADFLGLSAYKPEALLAIVAFLRDGLGGFGSEDMYGDGQPMYGRHLLNVLDVVVASGACIDEDGWVSRKAALAAGGVGGATADMVAWVMASHKYPTPTEIALLKKYKARMTKEMEEEAKSAVEWAKAGLGGDNDYLNNLGVCATRGVVGADKFGIVVSLIATWRREMETLRVREREVETSKHVGTVKARMELKLKLEGKPRAFEGGYGNTYLHKFRDEQGNLFIWWTGTDVCFDDGWEVETWRHVKATVKAHEEFKGVKQTVLTRLVSTKPESK